MTRNQKRILPIVQANPEGITALEVHKATRISFHSACAALRKLREAKQITGRGGVWKPEKII